MTLCPACNTVSPKTKQVGLMNFYPHHIGDFNKKTIYLTRVQRSVYRDALDMYYDTERPLPSDFDVLCRKLMCHTDEEKSALKTVLGDYFELTDGGYFNSRCEEEIEKYRKNTSAKARAGIASAAARKQKSTRVHHTLNICATNQEPITNNQEPRTNDFVIHEKSSPKKKISSRKQKSDFDFSSWLSKPSDQVLSDWIAMRKAKQAPASQTVINQFATQVNLAFADGRTADDCLSMCIVKGWQGFKYQWLLNEESKDGGHKYPVGQSRSERNDQALRDYFAKIDSEENFGNDLDGPIQPEAGYGASGEFGSHAV